MQGYMVGEGGKNTIKTQCLSSIDYGLMLLICVTYWNTGGAPPFTQAEAAVKVNVSVFILEQEEQGRETSPEGRATLNH